MIKFSLRCEEGHEFEAWFASGDAFEQQKANGELCCPACNSSDVDKALMAPRISKSPRTEPQFSNSAGTDSTSQSLTTSTGLSPESLSMLRELKKRIVDDAEYVGPKFAEEARRIHYEETEKKGVWGEASLEDARDLIDEGIEILPIPVLPEDQN